MNLFARYTGLAFISITVNDLLTSGNSDAGGRPVAFLGVPIKEYGTASPITKRESMPTTGCEASAA
jgi:hypothetical protein